MTILTTTMQLEKPESGDEMEPYFLGTTPSGSFWTILTRLSEHDHTGGLSGKTLTAATIPDGSITPSKLDPSVYDPLALVDGSKPFTGQVTMQADAVVRDRLSFGEQGTTLAPDAHLTRTDAGLLSLSGAWHTPAGAFEVKTGAPPGTTRLQVAQNGTVTITPDTGVGPLVLGGAGSVRSTTTLTLACANNWVHPETDGSHYFGLPVGTGNRWYQITAVVGSINTSLAEAKQDITPLAPEDALAAVRATDPVLFDYRPPERGPEWYELPDDPEQAAEVLEQRMRAAPLEEGARHQAGFVLHDATGTYTTDPLFETGEGQSNAANSVGVLLAALKAIDARVTQLEGA